MKNILITILSLTLSYPSFASLGPDTDVPSLELGAEIQLDDKLSEELKDVQGPVFLYSEPTDELFKFDKNTGTAFKSGEEEYQTASLGGAISIVLSLALGAYLGSVSQIKKRYTQECHYIKGICYITQEPPDDHKIKGLHHLHNSKGFFR